MLSFDEKDVCFNGLKAIADSIWWIGRDVRDFLTIEVSVREQSLGEVVLPTPQFFRTNVPKGEVFLMLQVTDTQNVLLRVAKFETKKGNPAQIDGVPEWVVDNPDKVALEPSEDGLSCLCKMIGPLGDAKVSMIADADLGEGVKRIVGEFDFSVVAGDAVRVSLEVVEVTEQQDEQPVPES